MTPAWILSLIGGFVRIAGEEAAAAHKRRKAAEAEAAAAKQAAKDRAAAARAAAQAAKDAAAARAEYERQIAKLDEATRRLVLERNRQDIRDMRAPIPDVDEVYPTEEGKP